MRDINWQFVEAWAKERLQSERNKNDAVGLPEHETNAIRGRIGLLKELLRLPNEKPEVLMQDGEPD